MGFASRTIGCGWFRGPLWANSKRNSGRLRGWFPSSDLAEKSQNSRSYLTRSFPIPQLSRCTTTMTDDDLMELFLFEGIVRQKRGLWSVPSWWCHSVSLKTNCLASVYSVVVSLFISAVLCYAFRWRWGFGSIRGAMVAARCDVSRVYFAATS